MRATVVGILTALCLCAAAQNSTNTNRHRADWMHEAQWGVFTHYLANDTTTVDEWNKAIDAFDANGLAEQLASVGAKYYVITLGQNSGHYLVPNATYDKYVGIAPSKCARRDLVTEIADALAAKGIRTMVYLPAGAPDRDPVAMEKLGWKNGKYPIWSHPQGGPDGGDDRLVEFQQKWQEIIAEWSNRWGKKVSGWWFDGCYFPVAMYKHDDAPNFASFAAAARAGNPDSIVAFNPGVFDPVFSLTAEEDYTAGEINDAMKAQCPGQYIDGAQFQMLSYLGPWWGAGPPRYSDPQVLAITRRIVDQGGAVTWDVPILPTGLIDPAFVAQLKSLGEGMKTPPAERGVKLNPLVIEGLDVTPAGEMAVRVAPGKIKAGDREVAVASETLLTLDPPRTIQVRDEAAKLVEDEPKGYGKGTPLLAGISVGTSIEGVIVPESIAVKAAPGPDATRFQEGVDWRADKAWGRVGRIPGGAITADTTVYLDYDYSLARLDTIEVRSDGSVVLRKGAEHKMCPQPPMLDAEAVALANVFLPYHTRAIAAEQIYPVGPAYPGPSPEWLTTNRSYIPKSLEKLAAGGPFTLLFWGDSVTCGGDVSTPDKAFPQSFTAWLRNRYPMAQVNYVNAGTGGWNSDTKLPLFQQEVLDKKPDLVVIEFVNDMGFTAEKVEENYTKAIEAIRAQGGEVIIVTPHFVRPDWMPEKVGLRTHETRPTVVYLRQFAAKHKVALADTSRRWEHLWIEGTPYMTFEYNAINHPDDRGHDLFVQELRRLFH
ncbi:MAG: GDSL-type esterase/lipase family protein [FCB group bacterium]|jgi:lysophospholipase L1-like esterase|nr:GDSL-type esterase/lipase family protein [FCB group bacterium]